MEGIKPMCEHCPIEKELNGTCYDKDGTWSQDEYNNWIFNGVWKCIFYDKETDSCDCSTGTTNTTNTSLV